MNLDLSASPAPIRWIALVALSGLFAAALSLAHLSAAFLLGPMAAAILLAATGSGVTLAGWLAISAQAIVGAMIARSITPSLMHEAVRNAPVFVFAVASVLVAACGLGWLLMRRRVLPGTTALWGSFPGAATAMVLMAEAYGADIRLVAFMQYLRVVLVTIVASSVAFAFEVGGAPAAASAAAPAIDWGAFAATLAVTALGALLARAVRMPAGALLGPMILCTTLRALGWLTVELPPACLALAYAVIGWMIGLRFTREILAHVATAAPRVAMAILALIGSCAIFAVPLVLVLGVDPLTAYLAMSPGGADSVAIIAASSGRVDLPFVMALQMSRFLVMLVAGPSLARVLVRRAGRDEPASADITKAAR